MDRRSFIKAGAALGTLAGVASPAIAQSAQQLKMVTSWPKNFPGLGTAASRFAARFEAATDGRYKITVFPGGELVHPLRCFDAVQKGQADLYHSADYYYQDKSRALAFFTTVPFGFTPDEMYAWLRQGGGQALWDDLSGQFGIKAFACGNTGAQMGGWFKKEMRTLDDFKGLKMRIPGFGGDVIRMLGGTPVITAGSEILHALQTGMIDAAEWVGPWNDLAFGFHKVVKHYHYPGFHEPGTTLSLGLRRALWEKMSKTDQAILEACAAAENTINLAEFNAHNAEALETLTTEDGVKLHEFSDEIFRKAGEAAKAVLAEAAASDPPTKKVHDSFLAFRKRIAAWSRISNQAYMNKRALVDF
jgi:TRAP-type mannitol/chloroaromatic compound transport system substrate-binding protein